MAELPARDIDHPVPRTHSLVKLAEKTILSLTEEQKLFFDEVRNFNLEVHYPDATNFDEVCCLREFLAYQPLTPGRVKSMPDFQLHEIKDFTDERDKRPAAMIDACFKHDLRQLELKLTPEINLLKWMIGFVLAGIVTLVLKAFFM